MVRHSSTWVFNIRQHNWHQCARGPKDADVHGKENVGEPWQGVRSTSQPDIRPGDLILARRATRGGNKPHGVLGIWKCHDYRRVTSPDEVPWTDGPYNWVIYCRAVQRELSKPFQEAFGENPSFPQQAIQTSYRSLSPEQASDYHQAVCTHQFLSEESKQALGCTQK
jgi:hypothetical protein